MSQEKATDAVSEYENTNSTLQTNRLSMVSGATESSEYMEPVSLYSEPGDDGRNNRLRNNNTKTGTGTSRYATVCFEPQPPTLPNANGIRARRTRTANRRCPSVCDGVKLKRRWGVVEQFIGERSSLFLFVSIVMGVFGCIGFLVAIGVAVSGTGHSANCACASAGNSEPRGEYLIECDSDMIGMWMKLLICDVLPKKAKKKFVHVLIV